MNYRVEVTSTAKADVAEAYLWISGHSAVRAARWFNRLMEAAASLEAHPERCPLAPESEAAGREIRQLLYGKRNSIYRILFEVRGDTVYVLHIRHGARRTLEPHELNLDDLP